MSHFLIFLSGTIPVYEGIMSAYRKYYISEKLGLETQIATINWTIKHYKIDNELLEPSHDYYYHGNMLTLSKANDVLNELDKKKKFYERYSFIHRVLLFE